MDISVEVYKSALQGEFLNFTFHNKRLIMIMRKIFGPTRTDDGYWRIKTNQEINNILKGQNIIEFIKNKD